MPPDRQRSDQSPRNSLQQGAKFTPVTYSFEDHIEAHAFAVKRDNIQIARSEIRAFNASKEARSARLEGRTLENTFFEVEEDPMYGTGIAE
ncbi:hypothetical protein TNCV_1469121 [Trichonephila clavipes]|nr:hypothetical protein TNCV_1469121 [Trichonephila clavipes]